MNPWFLVECALLKHEKLAKLPNDSARFGWFVVLAEAKLQRKPGRFASEAHFRLVMGRHARFLKAYVSAKLLDRVGDEIHVHDWQRHQWAAAKAQQRETGGGHSEDTGETKVGQKVDASRAVSVPVSVDPSNDEEELTSEGGAGGNHAAVFAFLAQHGAYIRPESGLGQRLYGLIDRRGEPAVLAEAEDMASIEPVMSDRQWVLGLENGLEQIPSGRKSIAEAIEEEHQARSDARYERMVTRRVEWFRQTGKWDEAWGPKPEAVA